MSPLLKQSHFIGEIYSFYSKIVKNVKKIRLKLHGPHQTQRRKIGHSPLPSTQKNPGHQIPHKNQQCQHIQMMQENFNLIYYYESQMTPLQTHPLWKKKHPSLQNNVILLNKKNSMHKNFRKKERTSLPTTLRRDFRRSIHCNIPRP